MHACAGTCTTRRLQYSRSGLDSATLVRNITIMYNGVFWASSFKRPDVCPEPVLAKHVFNSKRKLTQSAPFFHAEFKFRALEDSVRCDISSLAAHHSEYFASGGAAPSPCAFHVEVVNTGAVESDIVLLGFVSRSENGFCLSFFHANMIILPRQARDNHNESSKRPFFLQLLAYRCPSEQRALRIRAGGEACPCRSAHRAALGTHTRHLTSS